MIVVIGSRHDPVAVELARRWPGGALCDATDLVTAGWNWPADGQRTWVVGGRPVPDADVTGVFLRRTAVHPEELLGTHPDDRAYLAAETLAMLVYVLATTSARVVNPIDAGTLGLDALRPERWRPAATELGVRVAPLRVASAGWACGPVGPPPSGLPERVEVVGGAACGDASPSAPAARAAADVARALGLHWVVAAFDGDGRLATLTTSTRPSPAAVECLAKLLGRPGGRS